MRAACLVATALFTFFAYLQLNDLEQYGTRFWAGWLLAYACVAAVSAVSAARALPRAVYLAGALVAAVAAVIRSRDIEWAGPILRNETNPAGNETTGLLLAAIWLALLAVLLAGRATEPADG